MKLYERYITTYNLLNNLKKSDTVGVFIESLSNSFFNLISIIMILRIMGYEYYGQFAFSISILIIAQTAGNLGLDGLLIKKFIENNDKFSSYLGTAYIMKSIIFIPTILIINIYAFMNDDFSTSESVLLSCISTICFISPITTTIIPWLYANQEFRLTSYVRVLSIAAGNIFKLALIIYGSDITMVGAAHAAMFGIEAISLYLLFLRLNGPPILKWHFNKATAKDILFQSNYLFLGSLLSIAYIYSDIIMMRYIFGARAVGEYALIPQILLSLQVIPTAITLVAFPKILEKMQSNSLGFINDVKYLAKKLTLISIAVMFAMMLIGPHIIELISGGAYQSTANLFSIACLALPFMFARLLTTKLFICFNRGKSLALIELISLSVNIAANYILITSFKYIGAVTTTLVTYLVINILSVIFLNKYFRNMSPQSHNKGR